MFDKTEFGTFTTEFSNVLILVLLNVMSSTVPSYLSNCIQSPTTNGLSKNMTTPPNKFFAVSCAANVTISPVIPNPAINPFKLIPSSVIIKNIAITYITKRIIFRRKLNDVSTSYFSVAFIILYTSADPGTKLFASPLANIIIDIIENALFTIPMTFAERFNGVFKKYIAI